MGSGTSAIAAISESRNFIGIEKEKVSVEIAQKAVKSFMDEKRNPEQMELMIREIEAAYELQKKA